MDLQLRSLVPVCSVVEKIGAPHCLAISPVSAIVSHGVTRAGNEECIPAAFQEKSN